MNNFHDSPNPLGENDPLALYIKLGWSLLPCYGITDGKCNCGGTHERRSDAGKHPVISDWTNLSSTDPSQIQSWFMDGGKNNPAVFCKPSGLVVIDIDPRNGGDESFLKLEAFLDGQIPVTAQTLTGQYLVNGRSVRGRHLYFKAHESDQFYKDFSKQGFTGIDIKHKGYVILPPSEHFSGVRYEWADGLDPVSTPVAALSPELEKIMLKKTATSNYSNGFNTVPPEVVIEATHTTDAAQMELAKQILKIQASKTLGNRNNTLNDAAFVMGQYVAGGQIPYLEVKKILAENAAIAFGDEDATSEIETVLRPLGGGFEAGAQSPIYPWGSLAKTSPTHSDLTDAEYLEKFNKVDLVELWKDTREEEWLVPGIICEERGHTWYSEPGIGKSLMVREMCAKLATGQGVFGFAPKEPMSVVYIDHENIPRTDIKRSLIDMGFTDDELKENFHLFSFPEFAPFDVEKGGQELKRCLEILKPRLVVIDTASRTVSGKENDNDTWINFYNHTGKILKAANIAYIRIDHTGKNTEAGPRGGSAKMGDVDIVWQLKEIAVGANYQIINEKHRVPMPSLTYVIKRSLEPLQHTIRVGPDWELILKDYENGSKMLKIIEDYIFENPTKPTGETNLYDALKKDCRELKMSKKKFLSIRKEFFKHDE